MTMGIVSAQDVSNNETIVNNDVLGDVIGVSVDEVSNIYYTDVISANAGDSSIDIHTKDSYNPTTKNNKCTFI